MIAKGPIVIGIGANLPHPVYGAPIETCRAALQALSASGIGLVACSRFYESDPVPPSDQPRYANAVAQVETEQDPAALLAILHRIEEQFGRVRRARNEARVLDLDLIIHGDRVSGPGEQPVLPHPRMHERAFVLLPMRDILPAWRHPASGASLDEMIAGLPDQGTISPAP